MTNINEIMINLRLQAPNILICLIMMSHARYAERLWPTTRKAANAAFVVKRATTLAPTYANANAMTKRTDSSPNAIADVRTRNSLMTANAPDADITVVARMITAT